MTEYTSISLPKKFIQKITDFIETHPEEAYSSIADFIKEASRVLLRELTSKDQKSCIKKEKSK